MPSSEFDPRSLRPADEVAGWRVHHLWRRGFTALQVTQMMMMHLTQAVDAMRREGVHHGAIGPKNILMRDADSPPMLVDFSLADWPGNPFPPEHNPLAGLGGINRLPG